MIPGEYVLANDDIIANAGRKTAKLIVSNTGDRPIQVGSHYHFFETNRALDFDRATAWGMRLNIPAGTAVRFEPGEQKQVEVVEVEGNKVGYGLNDLTQGSLSTEGRLKDEALARAKAWGFKGVE
ncbi:MAG: urease subunit beta [Clostridium sp.]|jgi:urease beta subunit|nr:urease subunit beta [Dethiobacter sp.]MBS4008668.1 urease subunit beta [Clostridium sp.]MCL4462426.1 urease subunit beta [Bacillota bacterium]